MTVGQWAEVMGPVQDPSLFNFSRIGSFAHKVSHVPDEKLGRFPAHGVSFNDCQRFVQELNRLFPEPGWTCLLPTPTELEYACRGGPRRPSDELGMDFYVGSVPSLKLSPDQARFNHGIDDGPEPVGSYPPNRLGVYDLHGNVFEHCGERNAPGVGKSNGLIFGGFWADPPEFCAAKRFTGFDPGGRHHGGGFRLVRVPLETAAPGGR